MIPSTFTERVQYAVLIPGEIHEDFTKSADIACELRAFVSSQGMAAYQVLLHDLTKGGIGYRSFKCVTREVARAEWWSVTHEELPEEVFDEVAR